jgi:hypothetical protein
VNLGGCYARRIGLPAVTMLAEASRPGPPGLAAYGRTRSGEPLADGIGACEEPGDLAPRQSEEERAMLSDEYFYCPLDDGADFPGSGRDFGTRLALSPGCVSDRRPS